MMKAFRRIFTALLTVLLLAGVLSSPASALGTDYTVYDDEKIYLPEAYEHIDTIYGVDSQISAFSNPEDVFADELGNIYIADSGNNRVLKLDNEGRLIKEISEFDMEALVNPTSVYADDKYIYITDTGNYRIVVFDAEGNYSHQFLKPESELLGKLSIYMPDRIVYSDKTDYMYVIAGKQLLSINKENYFQGYLGAEPVKFSLKNFLVRRFGSQKQIDNLPQSEPVSYTNICLFDGDIYAVTLGAENNIKILNGVGNNIFPAGNYGESTIDVDTKTVVEPDFSDIAVEPTGNLLISQANNSRIYGYDREGNMLFSFGGKGSTAGSFGDISSIACDSRGYIYILDNARNCLQIMRPTYFTEKIYLGNSQYSDGDYAAAYKTWSEIATLCPGYVLAHKKIGDVQFKQKDYEAAAESYKSAKSSASYAKAYDKINNTNMKKYFALAVLAIVLVLAGIYGLTVFYRRWSKKAMHKLYFENVTGIKAFLYLIPYYLFHPIAGADRIKANRKSIPYYLCGIILAMIPLVCIFKIVACNYAVSGVTVSNTSLALEAAVIIVPLLLWIVLSYLVTSLMSGEATIGETLAAGCYSMLPWIIFTPVLTVVSHFIGSQNMVFYKGAELLILVWVLVYLLLALGAMNDYSLPKTLLVTVIALFGMIIVCLAVLLFASLFVQLVDQVTKSINEINTLNM